MLKFDGKIVGKKREMRDVKWVMRALPSTPNESEKLQTGHTTKSTIMATDACRLHAVQRKSGVPAGECISEQDSGVYSMSNIESMRLDARKALRQANSSISMRSVVLDAGFLRDALSCMGDNDGVVLITIGGSTDPVKLSISSQDGKSKRFAVIMPMVAEMIGVDFWEPSVSDLDPSP